MVNTRPISAVAESRGDTFVALTATRELGGIRGRFPLTPVLLYKPGRYLTGVRRHTLHIRALFLSKEGGASCLERRGLLRMLRVNSSLWRGYRTRTYARCVDVLAFRRPLAMPCRIATPRTAKGLPRCGKGCAEVSSKDGNSNANGRARQSSLETMLGLCGRKDCVCLSR